MKRIFTILVIIFNVVLTKNELVAQNLVPNPSFEDTIVCPTTANQLNNCANWWPSLESPDYFHECDFITGLTGVPNNFCGFQYANSGSAYVGFIPFTKTALNGREYFTCQLLTPLTIGENYAVSFYLNWSAGLGKKIACNKIGAFFSTMNYNLSNPLQIMNFAHIYTDSILSDSINWKFISKSILADSNYSYLSIGNFFEDSLTDTIAFDPSAHSYYYIDDISVILDTTTHIDIKDPNFLNLFPNPFETTITIVYNYNSMFSLRIFNLIGRTVFKQSIDGGNKIILDLMHLSKGIYFLQISDSKELFQTYKLIKK